MGTNFYVKTEDVLVSQYRSELHIGKRSAAGWYCWDCRVTLCKEGTGIIDCNSDPKWYQKPGIHTCDATWYDECQYCGKSKDNEKDFNDSVGRELGFNKEAPKVKTGVKTCASFTWAMHPSIFLSMRHTRIFIDEYGKEYSFFQMLSVLDECPIWYLHVGANFS